MITKAKKLCTSLLSVSRQFRDEYTERCAGQQVLCIRDHRDIYRDRAASPPSNRAQLWAIEFFIVSEYTLYDLITLKAFLNLQTGPNSTVRSISIKLLFEDIPREKIESGYVRRILSNLLACEKVASMEIYLVEKLWDLKESGEPKFLIARWDRSDDMNITFLTPAMEIYDMGSEWDHPSDTNPACCDHPEKCDPENSEDEDEESGSDANGEAGNEGGAGNDEHGNEGFKSVDGNEGEIYAS